MQNKIIEAVEQSQLKKRPNFRVGDRIVVNVKLKEGDKERIQAFRGVVICKRPKSGNTPNTMFTVRKISEGVGVEKIFPLHSPFVDSIVVETSSIVRRSRLYYLRELQGKKARLKESERFGEDLVAKAAPVVDVPVEAGTEITGGDANPAPATGKDAPKK